MGIKRFGDKNIKIRKVVKSDVKKAEKFRELINSLVEEDAKILINKKISLREEKDFLEGLLNMTKARKKVYLIAEFDDKIIATTSIEQQKGRGDHVGKFGIIVKNGYRGIGLGKFMMSEIIKLAKKDLKPQPKIISLDVFTDNTPAINLYKKMRFRKVAKIPKCRQYKGKLLDEFVMILEV